MRIAKAWIPMSDGIRLACTLYMPDHDSGADGFAPILEYLPYRKDDAMFDRDFDLYSYVVPRGYVGARVDIRGTGASEGVLPDGEYSEQEQLDGMEVISWLARQPWSGGNVGMWGISWGGFNSIQMAMRNPPGLKAIAALMATDELFHDDVHYIDGILHVDEYVIMIDLLNALSAPPEFPLDDETLAARFDQAPWSLRWMKEQRDGPYWRRGSLRPRYERLRIPAMLVGGWFDGYRDSVPRMVQHLKGPVKAIVGPWNHTFPHDATPGPAIEWRAEAVRWWDRWLKRADTGVDREPPFAVFVQDWRQPDPSIKEIPGRWRWLDGWPPTTLEERELFLHPDHGLRDEMGPQEEHRMTGVPSTGVEAGFWWGEVTPDQRALDASGLVFESEPLAGDLAVVGMPRAELVASADVPLAHWFCRVCDVAPDGTSVLVAGGGVNGAHRDSPALPRPLKPGEWYRLTVDTHFTGWTFPAGHRVRMVISNSMWPMLWPAPYPPDTSLRVGGPDGSRLILPVLPPDELEPPAFEPPTPRVSPPGVRGTGDTFPTPWTLRRGEDGTAMVEWEGQYRTELPWSTQVVKERMAYSVHDDRPEGASVRGEAETAIELGGRRLVWRCRLDLSSDATHLDYRFRRELLENGRTMRERGWEERIPRDFQ
jgi:putative CocE/NonD family hydrolase